eukprot:m.226191 g.226191  ORF g.226191 m.226191 type:complete len:147 (-) comp18791_c0_seq3:69-509(-)
MLVVIGCCLLLLMLSMLFVVFGIGIVVFCFVLVWFLFFALQHFRDPTMSSRTPVVTEQGQLLPVRFLLDGEVGQEMALLFRTMHLDRLAVEVEVGSPLFNPPHFGPGPPPAAVQDLKQILCARQILEPLPREIELLRSQRTVEPGI